MKEVPAPALNQIAPARSLFAAVVDADGVKVAIAERTWRTSGALCCVAPATMGFPLLSNLTR